MQVILAVGITLGIVIVLALAGLGAFAGYKLYVALRGVRAGLETLNSNLSGIPALLDGIKNICQELAVNTVKVGSSVDVLKQSLFGDGSTSGPRRTPGMIPYDDLAADRAYQLQELERQENLADLEGNRFIVSD